MLKTKNTVKDIRDLGKYRFDTTHYITLKSGVRRESDSGRVVVSSTNTIKKPKK